MRFLFVAPLAAFLLSAPMAPGAEVRWDEMQSFVDEGWGFESHRSDGRHVVRGAYAHHVEDARAREFLSSLPELERLLVVQSRFHPGDIRSLARSCPGVCAIEIDGGHQPDKQALKAELWPEFLNLPRLQRLSLRNLQCLGDEQWPSRDTREIECLDISGNLSGMLRALLAPYRVRSLRIELRGPHARLTAADHAALKSQTDIESLEVVGSMLGTRILLNLHRLSDLSKLRRLSLQNCSIDPLSLRRFPGLESLTLHFCRFRDNHFDTLLAHPGLRELVLWECRNEDLGIVAPLFRPPASRIRVITLRFPSLAEIEAFVGLPCSYHVQLGLGGVCGLNDDVHSLKWLGADEVAMLCKLQELHGVSIFAGAGAGIKANAAGLLRLSRKDTLRTLEVVGAEVVQDVPLGVRKERSTGLHEVRFETRVADEFLERFLGASTRRVYLRDFSARPQAAGRQVDAGSIGLDRLEAVGLVDVVLPVSQPSLTRQLLNSSLDELVLELCWVNKGSIEQIVERSPSLKRLAFRACSVRDERELLLLNELAELEMVDFANTAVSVSTAQAMKAKSVWFGRGSFAREPFLSSWPK